MDAASKRCEQEAEDHADSISKELEDVKKHLKQVVPGDVSAMRTKIAVAEREIQLIGEQIATL